MGSSEMTTIAKQTLGHKIAICDNDMQQYLNNQEGKLERVTGIEPVYSAWKAAVLPLYYTRPARRGECRD